MGSIESIGMPFIQLNKWTLNGLQPMQVFCSYFFVVAIFMFIAQHVLRYYQSLEFQVNSTSVYFIFPIRLRNFTVTRYNFISFGKWLYFSLNAVIKCIASGSCGTYEIDQLFVVLFEMAIEIVHEMGISKSEYSVCIRVHSFYFVLNEKFYYISSMTLWKLIQLEKKHRTVNTHLC